MTNVTKIFMQWFNNLPDIDECVSNPCEHGATCMDSIASVKCLCPAGYDGHLCQMGKHVIFRKSLTHAHMV